MEPERPAEKPVKGKGWFALFKDLWELFVAAPFMIGIVYGVPSILVILGLYAALIIALNGAFIFFELNIRIDETGMDLRVFLIFLALPVYWVVSALFALFARISNDFGSDTPLKTLDKESNLEPPSDEGPGLLEIDAPSESLETPPLKPWQPIASALDQRAWSGLFHFKNIGIVLAGGGAKGVYQAGAMKAIYEFLQAQQALDRVVSVSGSSIGSWNTVFWLANLLDPATGDGTRSAHELWWTQTKVRKLVRPAVPILPGISRYLMSTGPWQRQFERVFNQAGTAPHARLNKILTANSPIHFYITRTNVLRGRLSFGTNNPHAVGQSQMAKTHDLDQSRKTTSMNRLKEDVFTSMGIPPVFRYSFLTGMDVEEWCEDGGVLDNLPVRLATAFDDIDLLFVLPLTASFFQRELPRMLVTRLMRVIDMRGGMLERNSLKMIYLFNMRYVLSGNRNPVPAFIIAPGQPLSIGTMDFFKLRRHGQGVFDQMYLATKQALKEFSDPKNLWKFYDAYHRMKMSPDRVLPPEGYVRMAIVDPAWETNNQFDYEDRF